MRVGSNPNPTDVGGMGQWASKTSSGNRSASLDGGSGGDTIDAMQDGELDGEAREESSSSPAPPTYKQDPMSLPPDSDSMRAPLMVGDVEEESKTGRRRIKKATPPLELSVDKAEAGESLECREETSPRGGVGNGGRNAAGGGGDYYGTFSPVPSPTYGETSSNNVESTSTTEDVKRRGGKNGSNGAVSPSITLQPPVIFKERWRQKEARIRKQSDIGHLPNWRLLPVIVKANDDLRQEQFASQLLRQIDQIVREAEIGVWMRPYDIVATSYDGGLIEAIPDTVSLDALRRNDSHYTTLADFFERLFAQRGPSALEKARQCFVESLAAYSIICFLLQVRRCIFVQGGLMIVDCLLTFVRCPPSQTRSRIVTTATSFLTQRATSFISTSAFYLLVHLVTSILNGRLSR